MTDLRTPAARRLPITAPACITAALATLAVVAAMLVTAPPAAGVADVVPARAGGATRLETAVIAAGRAFPQGSLQAVIGSSQRFTEPLAGAALAGALGAPMLLTPPTTLAATTADALQAMGVERVTLLGGFDVIAPAVEDDLARLGIAVDRVGGADAYASAAEIASAAEFVAGGLPVIDGARTVAVASGEDFPDALAISGPSFEMAIPLLLTRRESLPEETSAALAGLDPEHVIVVGGTDAISEAVEAQIAQGARARTTRLGGIDRTDTATVVADYFSSAGVSQPINTVLVRGDDFPDALTAGQVAAFLDAPILLTATPGVLGRETAEWFTANCITIEVLQVVGGTAAVSIPVADEAEARAESCDAPETIPPQPPEAGQTYIVSPQQALSAEAPASVDFTVGARYDEEPLTGPLDLVLFPCDHASVTGSGDDVFLDADDDGHADGFGTTATGNARIVQVNGEDIPDTTSSIATPDEDGDIDIRLYSAAADCVVLVVLDGNGNGELDLDAQDRPAEPYGVGRAEWTTS